MLFSDVGDVIDLVAVAVSVSITTSRTPGRSAMTARSHATPSSESSHPSPSGPSLALTTRHLSAPAGSPGTLPRRGPLRTARAAFTASSSSKPQGRFRVKCWLLRRLEDPLA